VTTDRAVLRARVVVAADGSNSTVRQRLGWRDPAHLAQLLEVLTPVHGRGAAELSRDGVALFEFGVVAGGVSGYYWDFPCSVAGQPAINRGVYALPVALSRQKRPLKSALADSLAARQLSLADCELRGHPVRTFNPEGRLCTTRILLVGDAAGVDPMYAEGISFALAYGEAAAASISSAFSRGRFDFVDYPRRVRAHALLGQLPARVQLARWGSHLRDPRALDLLWRLGARALKLTRWDDRGYVPAADDHARILRA
jgi:menaquinone-9 beta-reductase